MKIVQHSPEAVRYSLCNGCFFGPARVVDANGISIASAVFAADYGDIPTDRPIDHATRSVTIGGAHSP